MAHNQCSAFVFDGKCICFPLFARCQRSRLGLVRAYASPSVSRTGLSECIWQFSPRYKAEPSATPMLFNASLDKIRKCGAKVLFFCMQRCFTPMKTGCRGFSPCFRARMGEVSRRPFMRIGFSALCPVSRSSCKPGRRPGSAIRKDPMPARCLHSRGTTAAAGTRGPGRCSL